MYEGMIIKNIHVSSTILICLGYNYFISSKIQKGLFRFISLIPVLCIFSVLPLYFYPVISTMALTWGSLGTTSFRLILFAFGKGPISISSEKPSFYNFIVHATLPIQNPSSKIPRSARKPPNLALEVVVLAIDLAILAKYKEEMNPKVLIICYGAFIFLGLDINWTCTKFLFSTMLGFELEPLFDTPYLSTSLHNFWSSRWNLTVTNLLGQMVYKPVRSVVSGHDELARLIAVFATFLVSGLWHEVLCCYMTRKNPSWETTLFFVLHGICVILEFLVKKACNGRIHLPPIVSIPVTVGFWIFTCVWLLVPPLIRDGVDAMVARELNYWMDSFLNGIAFFMS